MANFDWRQTQNRPLADRFPDTEKGWGEWRQLVTELSNLGTNPSLVDCQRAFDIFLQTTSVAATKTTRNRQCRVFVSHRGTQQDTAFAERIAFLAARAGYEYWLDIHDPPLKYMNQSPAILSPARDVLIAAIIEMGLLNASHVIAVMTDNSAGSKWIPYEFGRAKQRLVYSSRSAIWLEPNTQISACGEYVYLGMKCSDEGEIDNWLKLSSSPTDCTRGGSSVWPPTSLEPAALPAP